jgi:hypothetical protein
MPDEIDRAQFRDQQYQDDCERERRYQAEKNALPYTGSCYFCDAILPEGHRFCDVDCRDGYEHEIKLKRMQGVK